ncbi:MAG: NUDIX domain-containing protein [Phycisphaeraceae bacterium]|nr:NUDIX domain-containing protein [Phycisphaeraceae bacterium]
MRTQSIEFIARGVLRSENAILLCINRHSGYGYLPGGHVEFGESASDALARECAEEFGTEVIPGPLLLVQELIFEQKGRLRQEVSLVFHVEHPLAAPVVVPSLEAEIEFAWVQRDAIASVDLRPVQVRDWLAAGGDLRPGVTWIPSR